MLERRPEVDYFEVIADNFMGDAEQPRQWLLRVAEHYPIVIHSVGLNLLGADALDERYLERLRGLVELVGAPFASDHLCWSALDGARHHDLLPTPFTAELVDYAAERASLVQRALGCPFGLENLSSYLQFKSSTMSEWDFYVAVVRKSGTHFMLDVNNVFVSSHNHGFDPRTYLREVDMTRVLQVHLAGHEVLPNGALLDTHDRSICDPVLALYAELAHEAGAFKTLIEWDDAVPPLAELLAEVARVRGARP